MAEFICGGDTYEVGGPRLDIIGLPVKPTGLPPTLEIEGYTLQLKTAFHCTLVAVGKIAEKNKITDPNFLQDVIGDFCKFVQENSVELLQYTSEFRFMVENERRAVVAMCDVSNLDKFFDHLNIKYNLELEYPPTHVTLYTLQPDKGILMTTAEYKEKLTKIISVPIKL